MIIPIRCFSCANVLADKYEKYVELTADLPDREILEPGNLISYSKRALILNDLGLTKICCRTCFLTHVDFAPINYAANRRHPESDKR